MKVSYADLEYLYEQKRLETLKQRSQALAEEIDQTTADLQELERLRSLEALDAESSTRGSKKLPNTKVLGQPWGNYLFLCGLLILLVIVGVSL
ncbi:MAG: hypothetical protein F6K00_32910 [Leptolyngbya sp. SIOISBB]|nr:hypothetical protein [Leptolyngbya sp. SIOISBB]